MNNYRDNHYNNILIQNPPVFYESTYIIGDYIIFLDNINQLSYFICMN